MLEKGIEIFEWKFCSMEIQQIRIKTEQEKEQIRAKNISLVLPWVAGKLFT